MTILDTVLTIILLIFVGANVAFGLLHALGSVFGLILGILLARVYYADLAGYITPVVLGNQQLGRALAFIAIFIVVARIVGLIFHFGQKAIKFVPLAPTVNRLIGGILGLVEGALAMGLLLYLIQGAIRPDSLIGKAIGGSALAAFLITIAKILLPLVPDFLKKFRTLI